MLKNAPSIPNEFFMSSGQIFKEALANVKCALYLRTPNVFYAKVGDIAQLVERCNRTAKVRSSNLLISTTKFHV